jgi:two-component system response regulator ChvI
VKPRLALIDDDKNILTSVAMALEAEGFVVSTYEDGAAGLAGVLKDPPDLVVLDVKMPRMDGMEVLRRLRETSRVPVVFLTSKDEEIDAFLGFRMGADDYITKPFSQRLLIERLRALLRRVHMGAAQDNAPVPGAVVAGSLSLDDERHVCLWKNVRADLTVTEYLIVKSLAANPGHIKSRAQLMDFAYGDGVYVDDRTVDSHIKRIRRKFKDTDPEFDHIETVYGIGYRLKDG